MLKIGLKAKDIITGFNGVIIGKCSYITGCDQYLIQPELKDGSWVESRWLDENRLEVVCSDVIELDTNSNKGPCKMAPTK